MESKNWTDKLSVLISCLFVLGACLAAYTNIQTDITVNTNDIAHVNKTILELDKYDRFLQNQQETNDRKLLVVETKQAVVISNQASLDIKLDRILRELGLLGTSITELKTTNSIKGG